MPLTIGSLETEVGYAETDTTGSFTPTADALVVIAAGYSMNGTSTLDPIVPTTSDSDTVTEHIEAESGASAWATSSQLSAFQEDASPVSKTVSMDADAASSDLYGYNTVIAEIEGHDSATPIAQAKAVWTRTFASASTSYTSAALDATPAIGSMVLLLIRYGNSSNGTITPPTSVEFGGEAATLVDSAFTTWQAAFLYFRIIDGSETSDDWSLTIGTEPIGSFCGVAMEVAEAAAATVATSAGTLVWGWSASGSAARIAIAAPSAPSWAWTVTGSPDTVRTASGAHTWNWGASGSAERTAITTGTATWAWSATGTPSRTAASSGSPVWAWTATGTPAAGIVASGGAIWAWQVTGTGVAVVPGAETSAGAAVWGWAVTGTAERIDESGALHTWNWAVIGTGETVGQGAAVGEGAPVWGWLVTGTPLTAATTTGTIVWAWTVVDTTSRAAGYMVSGSTAPARLVAGAAGDVVELVGAVG